MSGAFHRLNAPTGSLQRVKDTCDMCSAAKVKCDKKKPMCSRCQRLAYPCFYSPARRVRKHRLDRNAQLPTEEENQICGPSSTSGFGDESVATESNLSDEFGLAWESNGSYWFPSQDLRSSAFSKSDRNLSFSASSDGRKSRTKRLKATPTGPGTTRQQNSILHVTGSDCAGTALDLLSQLNQKCLRHHFSTTTTTSSNDTSTAFSHDLAIEKASMAIRQTSTILICPCSRRPDIGFLATAVCSAILDLYRTFLDPKSPAAVGSGTNKPPTNHKLGIERSKHSTSSHNYRDRMATSKGGPMDLNPSPKMLQQQQRQQHHRSNGAGGGGGVIQPKAPIMRILGELPRMANLLTQFRSRYYYNNSSSSQEDGVSMIVVDSSSRDLLRALVATMTSRLKVMIDEFTHLLVDS